MRPLSAPYYAEVALTARCNLHCGYCYFRNSACETPEELTTGEWLDVFAEFGQMKMLKVILSGGEVLRSGCCWHRGFGKVFYFRPGHEEFPTYYDKNIQTVLRNAAAWAAPVHGPEQAYGEQPSPQDTARTEW